MLTSRRLNNPLPPWLAALVFLASITALHAQDTNSTNGADTPASQAQSTNTAVDEMGVIDRANRASIVINTVDARGLYTPELAGGIESRGDPARVAGPMDSYRQAEQFEDEFVMMDFASGTGGTFFHNGNNLQTGLRLAGAAPELSYVLGFSPPNQKMDGRFHSLKVVIVGKQNYDIKARRGYYAPKKLENREEQGKAEMEELVFSRDEIEEIPLELETQYFKTSQTEAHVSVVSHIDVKVRPRPM